MSNLGKFLSLILALRLALPGTFQAVERYPICAIQGDSFTAEHLGETVRVRGVVFADLDQSAQKGLFIQQRDCDDRSHTSDGIYIYLGEQADVAAVGDRVEVTGVVQEYYGMSEIAALPQDVRLLSSGNPLPAAEELDPPFDKGDAAYYFENHEGMYVQVSAGLVVGPTDGDERTWLVRPDLELERVFHDDPRGTGELICLGDAGLFQVTPEVKVGDRVSGMVGALGYRFGAYCLALTTAPQVEAAPVITPPTPEPAAGLRIASLNLQNLFDTHDNPATDDEVLSGPEYQRRLEKRARAIHQLGEPAVLALQEVENLNVLAALLDRPEIRADYGFLLLDGPDERGLDVAIAYQPALVQVYSYQAQQGCTALVDGLGPDGNRDVLNPQNNLTCDLDGDGTLDGNRLFSRPPLVAHLRAAIPYAAQPADLWLVANHWKSKVEDGFTIQYTLPRRLEQAHFVADLAQEIILTDPQADLVVLGDLNDHPGSQPLLELTSLGLVDLWGRLPPPQRYTYNYAGVSQSLDYVLLRARLPLVPVRVQAAHLNADYPVSWGQDPETIFRSSDHDPLWVELLSVAPQSYLPLVSR